MGERNDDRDMSPKELARRVTQTNIQAQKGMAADARERGDTDMATQHEHNADRMLAKFLRG